MAFSKEIVTDNLKDPNRLPDFAIDFATIIEVLEAHNILTEFRNHFKVNRKAGSYQPIDALLLFILLFSNDVPGGVGKITANSEPWTEKLAALAGRARLMTQQSCSRFLQSIKPELLTNDFANWLLIEASGVIEVMENPLTSIYDTLGKSWNLFDLDGKIYTLRQQALPISEDLPLPIRTVDGTFALPGYSGRKRGEIQFYREILQDAGSGVWLGCWGSPGNAIKIDVSNAAKTIDFVLRKMGRKPNFSCLRMDGNYGNWSVIKACQDAGFPPLVRWNTEVLKWPKIHKEVKRKGWGLVSDSGSGPQRYAAEAGILRNPKNPKVWGRLVVSRYYDTTGKGVGFLYKGWRYEVFLTQLSAKNWPATHVVTLYFGRAGEENRFAQKDREINLNRLFSTNLPGQIFVNLVGLFVWNIQTVMGFRKVASQLPKPSPQPLYNFKEQPPLESFIPPPNELFEILNQLPWPEFLEQKAGWKWNPKHGLRCPSGHFAFLISVRKNSLIFSVSFGVCRDCFKRSTCTTSTKADYQLEIQFAVGKTLAEKIRELKKKGNFSTKPTLLDPILKRGTPSFDWSKPVAIAPGPLAPSGPYLVPSELRHEVRDLHLQLEVHVEGSNEPRVSRNRFVAKTAARRQRRRLTWEERDAWNSATGHFRVRFSGISPGDSEKLLNVLRGKCSQAA